MNREREDGAETEPWAHGILRFKRGTKSPPGGRGEARKGGLKPRLEEAVMGSMASAGGLGKARTKTHYLA